MKSNQITVAIDRKLHHSLKLEALKEGVTLQELVHGKLKE